MQMETRFEHFTLGFKVLLFWIIENYNTPLKCNKNQTVITM